jgi:hypothetical protein
VHVELQLHQKLIAKASDEVGGGGGALHMADLEPRAHGVGKQYFARFRVKARQLVFDRLQRFEHLDSEKKLGPLLYLDDR